MNLFKKIIRYILPYKFIQIIKNYRPLSYYKKTINFWNDVYDNNMNIEYDCSKEVMERLLTHIESVWNSYGSKDVYWSVLADEKYLKRNINEEAINEFYTSGYDTFSQIEAILKRCGEWNKLKKTNCLEYGCGVGRVTLYLAKYFKNVIGVDISNSHLKIANEYMKKKGISNIKFEKISKLNQLNKNEKYNFIFSIIVLQHNPPPVIYEILKNLFLILENDGVLMFQVPVKLYGYNFTVNDYLTDMQKYDFMEMHMLPQNAILRLAIENKCYLLEVHNDGYIGNYMNGLSQTFVFKKNN